MRGLSRGERTFVAAFVAANAVVPFAVKDLYPFSAFGMFSARPALVSRVTVFAPDGNALDPALLDTWTLDVSSANPRAGFAVRSLNPGNRVLSDEEVQAHVGVLLAERELPFDWVDVEQTVAFIGSNGDVTTETRRWQVAK